MIRNVKDPVLQEKEKKNPAFESDSFATTAEMAPPTSQLKAENERAGSMGAGASAGAMQFKSEASQMKVEPDKGPQNVSKFTPSGGAAMPAKVLDKMNSSFGTDFSGVKIHKNSPKAEALGAKAVTEGNNIHFKKGKFNPDSESGQQLLGHELTHVVQQQQGRVNPTTDINGAPVNDDQGLELEADQMGRKAARGERTGLNTQQNLGLANSPMQAKMDTSPFAPNQLKKEKEGEETHQLKESAEGPVMAPPPSDSLPNNNNGTNQLKAENVHQREAEETSGSGEAPQTVVDITNGFNPPADVAAYLNENNGKYKEINVKLGKIAAGKLKVKQTSEGGEGTTAQYQIESGQGIEFGGIDFLNPLRANGLTPVIAIEGEDPQNIGGYLTIKQGGTVYKDPKRLVTEINNNLESLGLAGISPIQVPDYENAVMNGVLTLISPEFSTQVGGFMNATGKFGMVGDNFVFDISADVDIEGLAGGLLQISRNEEGKLNGEADIDVSVANLNGNVKVMYAEGTITGQGTATFDSEKFSGSITMIFDEEAAANAAVHQGMGIESLENTEEPAPAQGGGTGKRVLVGFGSVTVHLTDWLTATANVGIDSVGHVTVHGQLSFPDQIELMEQKDKQKDLFDVEIKAGYGIPLVGQVFLFASIGMFVKAGFGPLVLRDIGMEGTYSTDPSVLQNFQITGALGISAYAMLGLRARAGVGLTLLGHDVKAGLQCDASAGIQAYAEARPTFEYREVAADGGKKGEAHLKGHFEAAAQLFLELAGAFFVELDSPWWSPAPDETWEWPFGSVQYPIGDGGFGIGADVDWLVGSPDVPEVEFSPVEFDPDKFISDMTKDPDNFGEKGKAGGEQNPDGKWEDGSGSGGMDQDPNAPNISKGLGDKPAIDYKNLPDEEKYMRALAEGGDLAEEANKKPAPILTMRKRVDAIKSKYGISTMRLKEVGKDSCKLYVAHAGQNNSKNLIEIKLISTAERDRLFRKAVADLESKLDNIADKETKAVTKSQIETAAQEVDKDSDVIVDTRIIDAGKNWDAWGDIEETERKMTSRPSKEAEGKEGEGGSQENEQGDEKPVTSESEVTEEDRKKHQEILAQIKEEIEMPVEGAINFSDLYSKVKALANSLIKKFQPQLRNGINLTADFQKKANDETDGDVDVTFKIAPNDSTLTTSNPPPGGPPNPIVAINTAYGTSITSLPMAPADRGSFATDIIGMISTINPILTTNNKTDRLNKFISFAVGAKRSGSLTNSAAFNHIIALNNHSLVPIVSLEQCSSGDSFGITLLSLIASHSNAETYINGIGIENFAPLTRRLSAAEIAPFLQLIDTWQASSPAHLAKITQGTAQKWVDVFTNYGENSGIPAATGFNTDNSNLENHFKKHVLYRPVHGSRTKDKYEPWDWAQIFGISVSKSWLETEENAGNITVSTAAYNKMFGSTLSMIQSKSGYYYFTYTVINQNEAFFINHYSPLYQNDYKNYSENAFAGASKAYLHTDNPNSSNIFISAEYNGKAYISAKYDNGSKKFKISSCYLPAAGPSVRMNWPNNLNHKMWDLK